MTVQSYDATEQSEFTTSPPTYGSPRSPDQNLDLLGNQHAFVTVAVSWGPVNNFFSIFYELGGHVNQFSKHAKERENVCVATLESSHDGCVQLDRLFPKAPGFLLHLRTLLLQLANVLDGLLQGESVADLQGGPKRGSGWRWELCDATLVLKSGMGEEEENSLGIPPSENHIPI